MNESLLCELKKKDLLSKDLSSFVLINSASCKIYYHKYIFGVLHNFV